MCVCVSLPCSTSLAVKKTTRTSGGGGLNLYNRALFQL